MKKNVIIDDFLYNKPLTDAIREITLKSPFGVDEAFHCLEDSKNHKEDAEFIIFLACKGFAPSVVKLHVKNIRKLEVNQRNFESVKKNIDSFCEEIKKMSNAFKNKKENTTENVFCMDFAKGVDVSGASFFNTEPIKKQRSFIDFQKELELLTDRFGGSLGFIEPEYRWMCGSDLVEIKYHFTFTKTEKKQKP